MTLMRLACCLAAAATVAAGCTAPQPLPGALVVGVLSATTGSSAGSGEDALRGAQLAVEVINDDHQALPIPFGPGRGLPGPAGAPLTLISGDTQAQTDAAVRQAGEFVSVRHAVGVVVADSAEVVAGTASEMQRLRVPLIDAFNTADYLTELGLDWYFRAGPGDRALLEAAFALVRTRVPGTAQPKIAVLSEPGGESAVGVAQIEEAAIRAASRVVVTGDLSAPEASPAREELSTTLAQADLDAVFAWAHSADGAHAISAFVGQVGGQPPVFGLGKGFRQLAQPPAAAPIVLRPVPWSAELARRSPPAQAVMDLYQQRFGHVMTEAAAAAFTAVIALAVAIEAAGSADTAAIRAALRQASVPATQMIMPWNGVRFAADGRNSLAAAVVEAWEGNDFRVVYPAELSLGPVRWRAQGAGG